MIFQKLYQTERKKSSFFTLNDLTDKESDSEKNKRKIAFSGK